MAYWHGQNDYENIKNASKMAAKSNFQLKYIYYTIFTAFSWQNNVFSR